MDDPKNYRKHLRNLAIILGISVICTFFFGGISGSVKDVILNIVYGILIGVSIAAGCHVISTYFFTRKGWEKTPIKVFTRLIVAVAFCIIIDLLIVNLLWFHFIHDYGFGEILKSANIRLIIIIQFIIGLVIYLVVLARHFSVHLNKYYVKLAETESQLMKYQYETLKNQLNPHFLFNTLNTLSGLIYKDVDKADQFIHHFSQIYRYVLDVQNEELVPIEQELAFIEHYLFLSNIRFNNSIQSDVKLSNLDQFIVPMALQLVIENAIKHNQFNVESPMLITLSEEAEYLKISNPLHPKEHKEPSSQLGIKNLEGRYAPLTDKKVRIEQTETHFVIYLPILKNS